MPHKRVQYAEGVFVGYRGYDRNGKQPLILSGMDCHTVVLNIVIWVLKTGPGYGKLWHQNTGKMDAAEAAQV